MYSSCLLEIRTRMPPKLKMPITNVSTSFFCIVTKGGVRTFRRDTVPCLLFRSFHLLTNRMQGGAVVYVPRVLKRPKVLVKDDVNHRCCREMTL